MTAKRITSLFLTLALVVTLLPAVPVSAAQVSDNKHVFALDIVTGADGLDLGKVKGSTVNVTYRTKDDGVKSVTFDLVEAYDVWHAQYGSTAWALESSNLHIGEWEMVHIAGATYMQIQDEIVDYSGDPSNWADLNVDAMNVLSNSIHTDGTPTSGSYPHQLKILQPYSSTTFFFSLPDTNVNIMTLRLELKGSDSVDIQQMRVCHVTNIRTGSDSMYRREYTDHYNGGFTPQVILPWTGTLYAQTTGETINVPAAGSVTYSIYSDPDTRRLVKTPDKGLLGGNWSVLNPNYGDYGMRIADASTGDMALDSETVIANGALYHLDYMGRHSACTGAAIASVELQFADFLGAGIDALLMKEGEHLRERIYKYDECMDLELTYEDVYGNIRRVNIPLLSLYMMYAIAIYGRQNIHKSDYTQVGASTDLYGLMQSNETARIPFLLHQYSDLISIKLRYGSNVRPAWSKSLAEKDRVTITNDPITLDGISFYVYDDLNSKYIGMSLVESDARDILTAGSAKPRYSLPLGTGSGQQLSNGSVEGSIADNTLIWGDLPARSYEGRYLVTIKNSTEEGAGTESPTTIRFEYTDINGNVENTPLYSIPDLVSGFYGLDSASSGSIGTYKKYASDGGGEINFLVDIPNVEKFESVDISLDGSDEWQIDKIEISKLEAAGASYWKWISGTNNAYNARIVLTRDITRGETLISAEETFLFQLNQRRVISFSQGTSVPPVEGDGTTPLPSTEKEAYLTSIPLSMTFEEASGQLGIGIARYTYDVIVDVADEIDSGSANLFYFQLVFENGSSGYVLANQQLASDSFKQGYSEVFRIRTTMNYGDLVAVNIICDSESSKGQVFDKLNIDRITVAMTTKGGVSKSWRVDSVGWIDIAPKEEGNLFDTTKISGEDANLETVRQYPITSRGTAVQLQLCITTASGSGYSPSLTDPGTLAEIAYSDYYGVERTFEFDLNKYIRDYSNNKTTSIFRAGKTDRLTVTLDNVVSLKSIRFTRTGEGANDWLIGGVAAQIVGELGAPYLAGGEYIRSGGAANEVTPLTTGDIDGNVKIGVKGTGLIVFKENKIEVDPESFAVASVSTPDVEGESETLRICIDLGPVGTYSHEGWSYEGHFNRFPDKEIYNTAVAGDIRGVVKYFELATNKYKQVAIENATQQTHNGRVYLVAQAQVSGVSSICSVALANANKSPLDYPKVFGVTVFRRNAEGSVLGVSYAKFERYVFNDVPYEVTMSDAFAVETLDDSSMLPNFTVQLQPDPGTAEAVMADANKLEVALIYEGVLGLGGGLRTPFQTLEELGCETVENGNLLQFTIDAIAADHVTGIAFRGVDEAEYRFVNARAGKTKSNRFDSHVITPFVINSSEAVMVEASYAAGGTGSSEQLKTVNKVTVDLVVPSEDRVPNAGSTGGPVSMTLVYNAWDGYQHTLEIPDIRAYMPADANTLDAGAKRTATLYLSAPHSLQTVTLSSENPLFLEKVVFTDLDSKITASLGHYAVSNWLHEGPVQIDRNGGYFVDQFTADAKSSGTGNSAKDTVYCQMLATTKKLSLNAYAGDTVTISTYLGTFGAPLTDLIWNGGLTASTDGFAIDGTTGRFTVPGSAVAGDVHTLSVCLAGDRTCGFEITVTVVEPPKPEPEPDWSSLDSGGSEVPILPGADATSPSGAEAVDAGGSGEGSLSMEAS